MIHTVGPVYSRRPEVADLLAACHVNSLALAVREELRTVAFPAISTGVYGYPLELAAPIALATTAAQIRRHAGTLDEVRFVLFDRTALDAFATALAGLG